MKPYRRCETILLRAWDNHACQALIPKMVKGQNLLDRRGDGGILVDAMDTRIENQKHAPYPHCGRGVLFGTFRVPRPRGPAKSRVLHSNSEGSSVFGGLHDECGVDTETQRT